jgi:hypothetical protein
MELLLSVALATPKELVIIATFIPRPLMDVRLLKPSTAIC